MEDGQEAKGMRLREHDKRELYVWKSGGVKADVYLWVTPQRIRAAIYPMTRTLEGRIYGEKIHDMRVLLYEGPLCLSPGMGISEGEETPCAWRITEVEEWSHQRAVIERIPKEWRG